MEPECQPMKSRAISNIEHLMARMLLWRNDTSRSLANRKTPYFEKQPALTTLDGLSK